MKIILKEDVANLGRAGEIVRVKDGYARNYLIPQQLAMSASTGNVKQLEHARRLVDVHRRKVAATSAEQRGSSPRSSRSPAAPARRTSSTGR